VSDAALAAVCDALTAMSPVGVVAALPGPTGERNTYALVPRAAILALAAERDDLLFQLAHVLAAGARAVWPQNAISERAHGELPPIVQERIDLVREPLRTPFDLGLIQTDPEQVRDWSRRLAERPGSVVSLLACTPGERAAGAYPLEFLLVERSVSVNTAAAGGNASLMAIG